LGKAAKGDTSQLDEINDEFDDDTPRDKALEDRVSKGFGSEIEHRFKLRPDLTVRLSLPGDLTRKEAERLADFVHTLPFEC
jgi:hypothetical protein